MAAVSTLLDAEPVVLEDLDFAPVCDICKLRQTSDAASWAVTFSCGLVMLYCQPHLDMLLREGASTRGKYREDSGHCSPQRFVTMTSREKL